MTERGLLIVLSGPSGVGKGTILRAFMPSRTDAVLSISATTRPPRPGEEDGIHYRFIDRQRFLDLIAENQMVEYAEYDGHFYGTPRGPVEEQLAAGKHVILEIELVGAMKVKQQTPDAVFVFIMPPSIEELRKRLVQRGTQSQESIVKRLETAKTEIEESHKYDYILVNDQIETCCRQLDAIIRAETCAVRHRKDFIQEVIENA